MYLMVQIPTLVGLESGDGILVYAKATEIRTSKETLSSYSFHQQRLLF